MSAASGQMCIAASPSVARAGGRAGVASFWWRGRGLRAYRSDSLDDVGRDSIDLGNRVLYVATGVLEAADMRVRRNLMSVRRACGRLARFPHSPDKGPLAASSLRYSPCFATISDLQRVGIEPTTPPDCPTNVSPRSQCSNTREQCSKPGRNVSPRSMQRDFGPCRVALGQIGVLQFCCPTVDCSEDDSEIPTRNRQVSTAYADDVGEHRMSALHAINTDFLLWALFTPARVID